tara:strand:- start:354 stop:1385 length:1032 start_codon:yes stop_codon:yes gene_type:complete
VKILVTGNLGYIGSVLVEKLINNGNLITGLDCGFYKDCDLYEYVKPQKQIIKDIRLVEKSDLNEIEAIIHLAALSNDPLGELIPGITSEINYTSTIKFAKMAKKEGVKKFIYISSQSMYGISKTSEPLDEDNSQKKPITEYAKTKWSAEIKLRELIDKKFIITFLRPATVFGASPRLRSDIVFNNLLGCAFTSGQIDIKSDGSPIRPVVHVQDLCGYIMAVLKAPENLINGKSYNVGLMNGNFTVKDMVDKVKELLPNSKINYLPNSSKDERTYRVSFDRINKELSSYYSPKWDLNNGGIELINLYRKINFNHDLFFGSMTNRIKKINELLKEKKLNNKLFFK